MHKNRFTENLQIVGNKYRIRETISVKPENIKTIHKEEKVIVENKEYNTKKHYVFRVWQLKERNANDRYYDKIIEQVIKNDWITDGLADHADDACDSVKDICFIEKYARMIDDWMCVDFYPIGEYGRRIEEILDVGGGIEISSSVLGDIDDDGYVFDATLERYGDWVRDCSNRQIHYKDHIEQRDDDTGDLSLVSEQGCITESVTILTDKEEKIDSVTDCKTDNAESENKGDISMETNEIAEASLKLNLKSMIKEAKGTKDLYAKKEILDSADLFAKKLDDDTIAKEIESELVATEDEIKRLSVKGLEAEGLNAKIQTLTDENNALAEKSKKLEDENKELEEKLNIVTEMYESKQYECSESKMEKSHNLSKEVCALKIKARRQESVIRALKSKNNKFVEKLKIVEAKANTMVDADDYARVVEERNLAKKDARDLRIKSLKEGCGSKDDRLSTLKKKLHKVDDEMIENEVEELIVNEEDDEDLAMMKMLDVDMPTTESEEDISDEDEDALMAYALR